ncbi:MAG: DUF1295 domain-containing protein [Pseudomonadota bacterium]
MSFTLTYGWLIAINIIGMIRLYVINVIRKRADIVDIGWAICLIVNALLPALNRHINDPSVPLTLWCFPLLFIMWYVRLATHLVTRYVRSPEEDARYTALRRKLAQRQHLGLFIIFIAQALLALGLSFPLWQWATLSNDVIASISTVQWGILYTWVLCSLIGQLLADKQLSDFKKDPSNNGQVMQSGLWKHSRHPNYFCEWLFWLHVALLGWWIDHLAWMIYPVIMYGFLRYFTGIPFSEQQAHAHRGEQYVRYQAITPAFFPWKINTHTRSN